jgi:hypothetical protein
MITLTNKQTNYSVSKEGTILKLEGTTNFTETGLISSFNGTISTLEGAYVGNFYYSESTNGKANRSLNDVDLDKYKAADALIDEAIDELKEQVEEL